MVTLSFTIFSGQKNYNRAHMLFQVLCGFEPIFYTTHPNEESKILIYFHFPQQFFPPQFLISHHTLPLNLLYDEWLQ